jgi:uncharacterized protein YjiS (DUF1127 family)
MARTEARARPQTAARRRSFWQWIVALDALYRNRRQLARLDLRLLEDAGLEWSEAQAEAARRSWDAPSTWYNFPRGR